MVCGVIGTKKRLVEDVIVEIQKHFFNSLLSHLSLIHISEPTRPY